MPLSITTQVPGAYFDFAFTTRQGGFVPLAQRVALVGIQTATTVPAGEVTELLSAEQADSLHGPGSELALMARAAFDLGALRGTLPRLYTVPLAEPAGGTEAATVTTLTVSGTAALADDLVLRIAGRPVRVAVTPTATPDDIAGAIKADIDRQTLIMPITATAAAAVVTCTHRSPGANGNDVAFDTISIPSGISVTIAQTTAGAGAADITPALDALLGLDINGVALANHTDTDITAAIASANEAWQPGTKRWRHFFLAETGTLATAQTLAAANDYRITVHGFRGSPSLPGEIAAVQAALTFAVDLPNYNYDGARVPLYPPRAADAWTTAELESLLAAGVTPLEPGEGDKRATVTKMVTTAVTKNGAPDYANRELGVSLTAAYHARQLDAQYARVKPATIDAIRDMVITVNKRAEAAGLLRNVDTQLPAITVTEDTAVPGRANIVNPIEPALPIHQAAFTIRTAAG